MNEILQSDGAFGGVERLFNKDSRAGHCKRKRS